MIELAIRVGILAGIHGYEVSTMNDSVNLIDMSDGSSTGYMRLVDALEFFNCLP